MKPENPTSLRNTLTALQAGDMAAFRKLFRIFEPKLYRFSLYLAGQKEDAEEVVQEVFLKVWERRQQIDPEQNFDGYLFSIAKHLVYNKARQKATAFAYSQYLQTTGSHTVCSTDETVDYWDLSRLLEDACASLPPVRRQVFILSRVEGKNNNEIARLLNTSNSNVENHLNKALKVIKDKFRRYGILCLVGLCCSLAAIL